MKTTRRATCPACHRRGPFRAAGSQRWPDAVAAAHGLPSVLTLWTCPNCSTTISEMDLLPYCAPVRATSPG